MSTQEGEPRRVLIAGAGYSFLHDWSVGPRVVTMLRERHWPEWVDIDDWSFGPLDASDKLKSADPPYTRVVFFGAVERGRPVGSVVRHQWHPDEMPSPQEVQERVGEAISGVISLDNLVSVCGAFGGLPDDVVLIEVEPSPDDSWGDGFSAEVEASLPRLIDYIEKEAALSETPATAGHEDSQ